MRKAEIVQRIAQELGCTTTKAEAAVEAILTMIKAGLQQGDPVILRRFGTWQVRAKRAPRPPFPPGGSCASSRASRSSRPSLELPTASNEPGHRVLAAANTRATGGSCIRRLRVN
jgi:hypothetical protein